MRNWFRKRQTGELEQLREENARLRAENAQLRQENAQLTVRVAELEARVTELKVRLEQNSRNSSKPPSSDPPSTPTLPKKPSSGRKPGGQPGHPRHQRELVPIGNVDKVIPVKPKDCRGCHALLAGHDANPHRHQITEIPEIKPHITEYQLHTLTCEKCNMATTAVLPEGIPQGVFGPKTVAIVSLLTGFYHLGRRQAMQAMRDLFGIRMCLGSVTACEQITSRALKMPVLEAQAYVKEQNVKHADETSWYEGISRKRVWLWVALTEKVTVILIRASRGADIAKDLLGEALGVLVTDRWLGYTWWPLKWRQLCWAHLKRHFQLFAELGGKAERIGLGLLEETKLLFEWWYRVRDGTLARSTFRAYVAPLRKRVEALLREGAVCGQKKVEGMCREILKLEPALWTFVRIAGVSPTNNSAERSIRSSVIWRRICFGTHSEAGSRFVERIMTVVCTLKQQERNIVEYVRYCVEATMKGSHSPSLLPVAT